MNSKKFTEAMSEIDNKYVDEAIRYKKKPKKTHWHKWGAVAACLCVVLVAGLLVKSLTSNETIAPGFLVITAYAASSDEEMIMQEGIELPLNYNWSMAMSSRPGLPLKLSADEHPNITFEVSAEGGALLLWEDNKITAMKSPFEIGNDTTIYWTNIYPTFEEYMESTAYINIVIQEEENIVGYAVVKVYTNDLENAPAQTYYAKLLKSVSFPKINGKYQKITSEYVQSEMESIADNIPVAMNGILAEVIELLDNGSCKVEVTGEDSNFSNGDTLTIHYNDVHGSSDKADKQLEVGDTIAVTYDDYKETNGAYSISVEYVDLIETTTQNTEADTVQFHDKKLNRADLSAETLEWLERYNSLTEEEQLAISSIPSDLYELCGYGNATEDIAPTEVEPIDYPPMVMFNNILYTATSYSGNKEDLTAVGGIESYIDYGVPTENNQANDALVGCEIYTSSSAPDFIFVLNNGVYSPYKSTDGTGIE